MWPTSHLTDGQTNLCFNCPLCDPQTDKRIDVTPGLEKSNDPTCRWGPPSFETCLSALAPFPNGQESCEPAAAWNWCCRRMQHCVITTVDQLPEQRSSRMEHVVSFESKRWFKLSVVFSRWCFAWCDNKIGKMSQENISWAWHSCVFVQNEMPMWACHGQPRLAASSTLMWALVRKQTFFSILTRSKTKLNPQCQHIFICVWEPTSLFIKVPTPRTFDCLTVWLCLPILWSQLPSVFASSHQRHWLPSTHKWKHDLRWKVAFGSHAQASNQNNPASTNEERTKFKKKSLTTFKEGMKHWILKQERPQPDTLSKRSQLQRKSFCEFSRSWLWSGSWSWLGLGLGCISWSKQASETTKRWLWQAVQVIFQQQLLRIKHLAFCQWKWGFDNFINPLTFFGPTLMNKCSPVSPNWKFAAWQRHSLWTTKIETLFAFVCHGCQCWPKHCVFGTIVLVGTCHKQQTDCLFQILSSSSTPNDPCFLDKILTLCWQKKNGTMSTTCHLLNTTFLVTEARLDLQVTQLFPSMLNDLAWTRDGAFVFTTS